MLLVGHHFHGVAVLLENNLAPVIDLAGPQTGARAATLERGLAKEAVDAS